MKIFDIACLACMLFFASCENNNSSTVGTYENEETSTAADQKEGASNHMNSGNNTETGRDVSVDTSKKNITGISKDSVASKATSANKKDTNFAAEKKKVKVQKTKNVDSAH